MTTPLSGDTTLGDTTLGGLAWPAPMRNPIRDYAWGSATALAELQNRVPSGGPEAELWMGAHPSAPSALLGRDGAEISLRDLVEADPLRTLGPALVERFGPRLPFLLKILAIARPLSVQVHPSAERAASCFAAPDGAPDTHRYVDPWPKPEMLYALRPVDALSGFRSVDDAARLLGLFRSPRLARLADALDRPGPGSGLDSGSDPGPGHSPDAARLEAAFAVLVTWPDDDRAAFSHEVAAEAERLLGTTSDTGPDRDGDTGRTDTADALRWVVRLTEHHPHDPLVAAPLLLDLVRLAPGEALFIPAGAPHAYLHGLGVEIMGSSDNVLRAGLTPKEIAVDELLRVVDGRTRPEHLPAAPVPGSPAWLDWAAPAEEFRLARSSITDGEVVDAEPVPGPRVLLCVSGSVAVTVDGGPAVTLTPGNSCFVGDAAGAVTLVGTGTVFRATVGSLRGGGTVPLLR